VSKIRYGLLAMLAGVSGLAGGMVGDRVFRIDPVRAQEATQTVAAETFVLVGKDGKPRARLGQSSKGESRLEFLDNDGKVLAGFGVSEDGWPEFRLGAKEGKAAITLLYKDGNPRLLLSDKSGKMDTVLAAAPDKGHLVLYKEGKARAMLALDGLDLADQAGQRRAKLFTGDNGEPILDFRDKEGRRLLSLAVQPLPKKEEPLFALYDKKDNVRVGLSLDEGDRPSLILRDGGLLSLIDKSGDDGVFISLENENRPSLLLSSKKGKHSAFLGLRESKELALDLLDEKNKHRASLLLNPDGEPALKLRDKDEKIVWSIPPREQPEPTEQPAKKQEPATQEPAATLPP
jgi:hypothetical protein